jgi:hypothetical protein
VKAKEQAALLETLKARFEKHMHRHSGVAWAEVQARLDANPAALGALREMEATDGEPGDV